MRTITLVLIFVLTIANCSQKKEKLVLQVNDKAASRIDLKTKKGGLLALEKFPEFSAIVYDIEANHTIITEYFEAEVRKKGKKSAKEYSWTGTTNCAEFVPKKNVFRFRFSGEDFDLQLKFFYKNDDYLYFTNVDHTKLVKLKVLNKFISKETNQEYIDSFELLSETNKLITSAQLTDFKNYNECVQWAKKTSEAMKNTSSEIYD